MEEEKAAREMNDIKERELWARRERLRQRRSRKGQTRMWLVVIKTLAASSWSKKRLEDLAVRCFSSRALLLLLLLNEPQIGHEERSKFGDSD